MLTWQSYVAQGDFAYFSCLENHISPFFSSKSVEDNFFNLGTHKNDFISDAKAPLVANNITSIKVVEHFYTLFSLNGSKILKI